MALAKFEHSTDCTCCGFGHLPFFIRKFVFPADIPESSIFTIFTIFSCFQWFVYVFVFNKTEICRTGKRVGNFGAELGKTTNSSRAEQNIPKSFKKLLKTLQNTLQNTFGLFDSNSTAHSLSKLQFTKVVYS
jgi:hypothetical protein